MNWKERFEQELAQAEAARQSGNEGKARVCARRAAGQVISEHMRRRGERSASTSAYNLLRHMRARPGLNPALADVLDHFLTRVRPDHSLPVEADLIGEARWLAAYLLEEQI